MRFLFNKIIDHRNESGGNKRLKITLFLADGAPKICGETFVSYKVAGNNPNLCGRHTQNDFEGIPARALR